MTDRELDVLVAEKALGMRVERIRTNWYHHEILCFFEPGCDLMVYSYDENACNAMMYRNGVDESAGVAAPLPYYSGEIEAAWEIVDALGLMVCPSLTGNWGAGRFKGTMGLGDGAKRYCEPGTWAESDTAPRAICLAALKAKGIAIP